MKEKNATITAFPPMTAGDRTLIGCEVIMLVGAKNNHVMQQHLCDLHLYGLVVPCLLRLLRVCVYGCVYVYMYVCMYVCVYVCVCVCIYV